MKFLIAGGTGFVGQALIAYLYNRGHQVTLLMRGTHAPKFSGRTPEAFQWDGKSPGKWHEAIEKTDIVINLCGESVVASRWTEATKKRLRDSRISSTKTLVNAIKKSTRKPAVLINASAVGFYGNKADTLLTESSSAGEGYLSKLCTEWENCATEISTDGVRVILLRIGVVLGNQGGVIQKMRPPFLMGLGGPLGPGSQWVPWIHISDLIRIIDLVASDARISGVCNACSPNPVTMKIFADALGKAMKRPSWFTVPPFMLKLLLGEMATVMTSSLRAIPEKVLKQDFKFDYEDIQSAMEAIVREEE